MIVNLELYGSRVYGPYCYITTGNNHIKNQGIISINQNGEWDDRDNSYLTGQLQDAMDDH